MKTLILMIPVVVLLAACGSGGGDSDIGGTAASGSESTPPAAQADSFLGTVSSVVGASSETAEPATVDATPASAPEDTEPMPLS